MKRAARRLRRPEQELPGIAPAWFMSLAVTEGRKGLGRTFPNPSVGAVIVKDGKVIGRGFHARAGGPHAEVMALREAGKAARGAELFTTLEPCNHTGRTGPCSEAILAAGLARVFIGAHDPNPEVKGGGSQRLREGGIEVHEDVLAGPCAALLEPFVTSVTLNRPLVTLKVASTLDGRSAASNGHSQWVTGEAARHRVHQLRDEADAVLVGAGTARADDPALTVRHLKTDRQPLRLLLEGRRKLPSKLQLLSDGVAPTWLLTTHARRAPNAGVEVVRVPGEGQPDLASTFELLGARGLTHVLVEAGPTLAGALLEAGLVDRLALFLAPKLLGQGLSWLAGRPTRSMDEALQLDDVSHELLGEDLLITARVRRPEKKGGKRVHRTGR